ncbi:SIS domain-containing protein [Heyndrickxia oleronia]|jgi:tagatose-6-phosphate ketose/aldose isomerase|uniref:SIS domain-containing protein n=1 Tax=Heyndrickxia oleronia TaxID=38875 RepID=UPI001ADF962B|nr:SIS domain-containing protein [Heyndrickxia oleronia]MEC1377158.1 SIS domain-containing protein [Heyndrickxia oleronia]QQZ05847.1 SIS domain-containing protein [Heyndrickxia oleronia]
MFHLSEQELERLGAKITSNEIKQQPMLWKETLEIYLKEKENIDQFLDQLRALGRVRVIFTGAGTSAYVGDTLLTYLKNKVDENHFSLESIPTTDIVSNPYDSYKKDVPTLLVSFARSGNSPESIAAVELGKQLVNQFYQLNITCAETGKLAQQTKGNHSFLLLMPPKSNDQGFAMTGSFTCMMLSTLLIFDRHSVEQKQAFVEQMIEMGNHVIKNEDKIQNIINRDFNRIVYLGSGSLAGLTREAQLKVLELTAGQYVTNFDSSLGFRHGPKSFVNEHTAVFVFTSNDEYTRKYDLDILEEIKRDGITDVIVSISVDQETNYSGECFAFSDGKDLDDIYLAFPYIMFAQTVSIMASLKVGNTPDTPSATGTVNRVVKGVTIHDYQG